MLFSSLLVLSAATVSVFAAPVAQADTPAVQTTTVAAVTAEAQVTAAHWKPQPPKVTTTTTKKSKTTSTTSKTTTTTATPSPPKPSLPLCKNAQLSFNIKVRGLDNYSGNVLPSFAIGKFAVDVGGPVGFSDAPQEYVLSNEGFITSTRDGNIFTVKTTVEGQPHIGDIVAVPASASIANNWSPLRCNGERSGTLNCIANNNNRRVLQVCGRFINMDPTRNANCQDEIAFDTIPTCRLV